MRDSVRVDVTPGDRALERRAGIAPLWVAGRGRKQRGGSPHPQPAQQNRSRDDRDGAWTWLPHEGAQSMTSLRTRLFAILVATTGLIWLCAAAWIYGQTKNEVERVLDTRLREAARMVQSLVTNSDGTASHHAPADPAVIP